MLDFIRRKRESLIVKIVFVLIILSFILAFGFSYIEGRRGDNSYAVKVNGQTISMQEFKNSYDRLRDFYFRALGPQLTPEVEKSLDLEKQALESLVDRALVMQEAKKMNIKVTDQELTEEIQKAQVFQKDGKFDFELYKKLLAQNGISVKDFEDAQRNELLIKKAEKTITDKAEVSDEEALTLFKKLNDKIDLYYTVFSPSTLLNEVKPTEADLQAHLDANKNAYMLPTKVSLSYLAYQADLSHVTVTDDEVKTYYNKNMDKWQDANGIIAFEKVAASVKAEALKSKKQKAGFEAASDALNKNLSTADINKMATELHTKAYKTDFLSQNAANQEFAGDKEIFKKIFAAKQGEIIGPFETAKGVYIIKIDKRVDASVKPLNDVREEVLKAVKYKMATDLAKKKSEENIKNVSNTNSTGEFVFSPQGNIPKIGSSPELMEAIFTLNTNTPTLEKSYNVGGNWVVVKLKNRVDVPKEGFEKQKDNMKKAMLPKKQQDALKLWIKSLREKAKIVYNKMFLKDEPKN